jgi:uncharacterized protein YecE (DUF72 family)
MVRRSRAAEPEPRVGISGWNYPPWRGVFYPVGLRQRDELAFASRTFSTIEINGSFYSLLRPQTYRKWYETVPDDFSFALKGSRFITHMKRLRDVRTALANFFASGVLCLGDKLGPILWQLPPRFAFDETRLQEFFALLPRTHAEAAALAAEHDRRLDGRSATTAEHAGRLRYALEVRHASFFDPRYVALLRKHDIASCVADTAGLYPVIDDVTADFVYVRLHGSTQLYTSGYESHELAHWAERIRAWAQQGPVFVYFDNDVKVRAPFDAANLARRLRGETRLRLPRSLAQVTEQPRSEWPAWRATARAPSSR